MYLTKEIIIGNLQLNYQIRELAEKFFKIKFTDLKDKTINPEDIKIDNINNLEYSYEINTSCHCHPEYETISKKIKLEEFLEWADSQY